MRKLHHGRRYCAVAVFALFSCVLAAVLPAAPASAAGTVIRIDSAAASSWTDGAGKRWESDRYYVGGNIDSYGNVAIANTSVPAVYRTERWGLSAYRIPVENGTYDVTLHWAENYSAIDGPGQRVFDVLVENTLLKGVDPFLMAGSRNKATSRTVQVPVDDGVLMIAFAARKEDPSINGIEVVPVTPPTTTKAPPPPTTAAPTTTTTSTTTSTTKLAFSGDGWVATPKVMGNALMDAAPVTTTAKPATTTTMKKSSKVESGSAQAAATGADAETMTLGRKSPNPVLLFGLPIVLALGALALVRYRRSQIS